MYGIPNSITEAPPSYISKRIDGVSFSKRKREREEQEEHVFQIQRKQKFEGGKKRLVPS
jgi:hypothetical protein